MAPVIHHAGDLNLGGLAHELSELAARTRSGQVGRTSWCALTLNNTSRHPGRWYRDEVPSGGCPVLDRCLPEPNSAAKPWRFSAFPQLAHKIIT